MSLIETTTNRTVFKKAESMMLVPYVYNSTVNDYVLGGDVYDISAIIGDSVVLEQSDGETTTKYNEFVANPLLETVSGSKYAFTAQCRDLQNNVLKSLFGVMTVNNIAGLAAFNDDFVPIYALIRLSFEDSGIPDVVLPMVKMNNKLYLQQLRTGAGQGNLAGTALSRGIAIQGISNHLFQFQTPHNGGTTYTPYTPVLFVPRVHNVFVSYAGDQYSQINFQTGAVLHNVTVNATEGTWSAISPQ